MNFSQIIWPICNVQKNTKVDAKTWPTVVKWLISSVENQRSRRLSRCPSEKAGVGGRGGRRLLTIWIVLLANLQQTGWGTNRWREGEGAVVGHSSRHPSRRRLSHMGFTELRGGGTGGEREKDRSYRREEQWEKGGIQVKSTAASTRSMPFFSNRTSLMQNRTQNVFLSLRWCLLWGL